MVSSQPGLHSGSVPLAVRMRPRSLDEVAGQKHLLRPGSPLVNLASDTEGTQGSVSVILWGPPGTGKTTLAQAIAHSSGRKFVELSAVTAGVKDVRQVMEEAFRSRDLYGLSTVLFLDEIHRFTKAQQDALLPGVENGWVILVAATRMTQPFSTPGSSASCWALLKRWISSRKSTVDTPYRSRSACARSITSRTSFTPAVTADNSTNRRPEL